MNFLRGEKDKKDEGKSKGKSPSQFQKQPSKSRLLKGGQSNASDRTSGSEEDASGSVSARSFKIPSARGIGSLFGSKQSSRGEGAESSKPPSSQAGSRAGGAKSIKSKRKMKSSIIKSSAPRGLQGQSNMMEYKSTTLGQQLTEATADDSLADVTFVVGPERKICKGLRIVMAARNKFLRKMLYDNKNEDDYCLWGSGEPPAWAVEPFSDGTLKVTFELPQTHGTSFDLMIKFIHSGGLTWEPHQTVQLLEVSIDFEVSELMKKCMELVAESMTDALSLTELTKLIQILLRGEGFDVNLQHPKTGTSALHIASREGGLDLVNDLLARGANLRWTDVNGATAIHLARSEAVASVLISANADITLLDKGGSPPLLYAIVNKRDDVRELLVAQGAQQHLFKTVQDAVDKENAALNKGPSPITEVKMSQTPEALVKVIEAEATLYPQLLAPPNLIEVARIGSIWGTRVALARGEDVNQRDEKEAARLSMPGYTALHWGAATGHLGVVQCLLSSEDIDVNPSDTEYETGYTPLQLCLNYKQRQWEQCSYLMQAHGAKTTAMAEDASSDEEEEEDEGGGGLSKGNLQSANPGQGGPRAFGFVKNVLTGFASQASRMIRPSQGQPSTTRSKSTAGARSKMQRSTRYN